MKTTTQPRQRIRPVLAAALAAAMIFGWLPALKSDDTKPDSSPKTPTAPSAPAAPGTEAKKPAVPAGESATASPDKKAKPVKSPLSGAELYSMHCARCHPERYPNERTSGQWKTIVLHMRIRANLPAEQANSILKYMQENSGY
jgi:mono/diheme cytochrome c family protein